MDYTIYNHKVVVHVMTNINTSLAALYKIWTTSVKVNVLVPLRPGPNVPKYEDQNIIT